MVKRLRDWLKEPVNAAKEPRWLAWTWAALAVPFVPVGRLVFRRLTRGGWAH